MLPQGARSIARRRSWRTVISPQRTRGEHPVPRLHGLGNALVLGRPGAIVPQQIIGGTGVGDEASAAYAGATPRASPSASRAIRASRYLRETRLERRPILAAQPTWLFRIAHNRALDLLRSGAIRAAEPIEAAHEVANSGSPDPVEVLMRREAIETAVSRFVELPTVQRSVVILKDVLDQSLEEICLDARPHGQCGEGAPRPRAGQAQGN